MIEVRVALGTKPRREVLVGKVLPGGNLQSEDQDAGGLHQHRISAGSQGSMVAMGPCGSTRIGKRTDVKDHLHWVIERLPDGAMELRPVRGWFEFGPPSGANSLPQKKSRNALLDAQAAAEQQREVQLRKELADRWDAMSVRKRQRLATAAPQAAKIRAHPSSADEAPLEDEAVPVQRASEVAYPDVEHARDETGLKKQERKRRKALRRQAQAAEEEAAPVAASALHELKRERGEDGWDFSDEEEFSDGEEERFDFDDQLKQSAGLAAKEVEEALSADEDEAEEVEGGDAMTSHGQQIQVLLKEQNAPAAGGGRPSADTSPSGASGEDESAAEDDESSAEEAAVAETHSHSQSLVLTKRSSSSTVNSTGAFPPSSTAMPVAASAAQAAPSTEELQRRVVACLQQHGGRVSAKELLRILTANQTGAKTLSRELLEMLRRVSTKSGDMVVLRPGFSV